MAEGNSIPKPPPPLSQSLDPFFIGAVPIFPQKSTSYAEQLKNPLHKEASLLVDGQKHSYADVLKVHCSFSDPKSDQIVSKGISGIDLKPISMHQGKPAICFRDSEKKGLIDKLSHVLIAKWSHGRPSMVTIRKFFLNLHLKGDFNLAFFDSKHMFVECVLFEDFVNIWLKGVWIINGFPLRMFKWSEDFHPSSESTIAPVWIHFPRLPLFLYDECSLLSIANTIGRPLKIDPYNINRTKLSCASICVEMDVSKVKIDEICIKFTKDDSNSVSRGFYQKVFYGFMPAYCNCCEHLGHSVASCKRGFISAKELAPREGRLESVADVREISFDIGTAADGSLLVPIRTAYSSLKNGLTDEGIWSKEQGVEEDRSCVQEDQKQVETDDGEPAVRKTAAAQSIATELTRNLESIGVDDSEMDVQKAMEMLMEGTTKQPAGLMGQAGTGTADAETTRDATDASKTRKQPTILEYCRVQNLENVAGNSAGKSAAGGFKGNRLEQVEPFKGIMQIDGMLVRSFVQAESVTEARANVKSHTAAESEALLEEGVRFNEQGLVCKLFGSPANLVEGTKKAQVRADSWADLVEEEDKEEQTRTISQLSLSKNKQNLQGGIGLDMSPKIISQVTKDATKHDVFNAFDIFKDRMSRSRGEKPDRNSSLKVLAARSLSPVGRSSEKMFKLRKRIENLKYEQGRAIVLEEETYKALEEYQQQLVSYHREKRQASSPKDSTQIVTQEMIADVSQGKEQDRTSRKGRNRSRKK